MIYCPKCGTSNDEDSFFCKKCGFPLDEEIETYNIKSEKSPKQKRSKVKTKNKTKTKVKYVDRNEKQKGKMSFFQSFMMFFFILLSICALAAAAFLGYYIYQNSNIVVPDVEGYTYETAERTLKDNKLQAEKIEQVVTDEDEVGIVIKQSKKSGSKVMENTVIKLTVGVLDTKVTVPNITNLKLEEALTLLNKNKVKYEIVYEDGSEDNIVLKQSIKAGKKIENTQPVIITVSKKETVTDDNKAQDDNQTTETNDQNQTNNE